LDLWFGIIVNDGERPLLLVGLDTLIIETSTDEALSVEDSICWVHGDLVLSGISDQTLGVGESDVGWCGSVTLVVGDNLDLTVLEHADT